MLMYWNNFDLSVIFDDNFYKRSQMSADVVTLYFRSTNGKGEKISLETELPVSRLYEMISEKMSKDPDHIKLYAYGK